MLYENLQRNLFVDPLIRNEYINDQRHNTFVFRPGPLFAEILLVDEINRATPRTQSALLEAMAERQVTVERETMPLPKPFLVLATQNPVELEGTFPLTEAQLDRFFLNIQMGYTSEEEEKAILYRFKLADAAILDELTLAYTLERYGGRRTAGNQQANVRRWVSRFVRRLKSSKST